eukprot:TRINITY_DN16635_c0_g1_i1.p1 TRINITY_DN16635_c0_g1~~TRINITY_DN16635_c0_g1_i1.p1  ORF type:complete len:153 (+),score=23.92 TRINITY_DN16635_c0_g1_i1:61-459(+)
MSRSWDRASLPTDLILADTSFLHCQCNNVVFLPWHVMGLANVQIHCAYPVWKNRTNIGPDTSSNNVDHVNHTIAAVAFRKKFQSVGCAALYVAKNVQMFLVVINVASGFLRAIHMEKQLHVFGVVDECVILE